MFVRLSGCNAWDGRPETRAASACPYCDTDFRGGERYDVIEIISQLQQLAGDSITPLGCVLTGGEPLLQADGALLQALGEHFAWVDIETNGTRARPEHPANVFVSCSSKAISNQPVIADADWWKILIPAQESFLEQALNSGTPVYVQPVCPDDGPAGSDYHANLATCLALCYEHGCRLSLQVHKYIGVE